MEREERVCRECSVDEIEDTLPLNDFLPCVEQSAATFDGRTRELIDGFEEMETESKTASILDYAYKDLKTANYCMPCGGNDFE